jgi:hypothetical protein
MSFIDLFGRYVQGSDISPERIYYRGEILPSFRPILYSFFTSGPYFKIAPTAKLQVALDLLASDINTLSVGQIKARLAKKAVPTIWLDYAKDNKSDLAYLLARSLLGGVTMTGRSHLLDLFHSHYTDKEAREILNRLSVDIPNPRAVVDELADIVTEHPSLFNGQLPLRLLSESQDLDNLL